MKKLIAAMAALAMLAAISTTALAANVTAGVPSSPSGDGTSVGTGADNGNGNVLTTTTQIDTYSANIAWGEMIFAYDFGTWNVGTHQWDNEKWVTTGTGNGFNGINNRVTVTNNSSQPIDATFNYTPIIGAGYSDGSPTAGAFTTVSTGSGYVKTADLPSGLNLTNIMELDLCQVDATNGPSGDTFLNLGGRPAASIGTTAAIIGKITVSLTSLTDPALTAALAKVTDAAVKTLPSLTNIADKGAVENALLANAAAAIGDSAYTVAVATDPTSTYNTGTHTWTGRFTVTDGISTIADAANRTITVVTAP